MANSKLQMPANYMALNESEMSCVEGGGIISQVCFRTYVPWHLLR